jgi:hypothetical protein
MRVERVGRTRVGTTERSEGAAAVEFALIFGFFVLLVFGSFELARAWNVHNVMDHAAREGARFGATETFDGTDATDAVRGVAITNLDAANVDIAEDDIFVAWLEVGESVEDADGLDGCSAPEGPDRRVLVCVPFNDYPLNFIFFTFDVDLQATAIARHEG